MSRALSHPQAVTAPTGTVLRIALVFAVAALLIAAFATGRVTAPDDSTDPVVPASADGTVAETFECPPSRPPMC